MEQTAGFKHTEKTILVVDDDPVVLKIVSDSLNPTYNILTAKSGEEAIQRSDEYKDVIDLLVTDFSMKGMTGLQLASKVTSLRPQIKVLLMSGLPQEVPVLKKEWQFLAKPFILSQLRALVAGLMVPKLKLGATI